MTWICDACTENDHTCHDVYASNRNGHAAGDDAGCANGDAEKNCACTYRSHEVNQPASQDTVWTGVYEGFTGCTDRDPDSCACATHEDPDCEVCGNQIEAGTVITTLTRTVFPLLPTDHPSQEWETHSAHADCCNPQGTQ